MRLLVEGLWSWGWREHWQVPSKATTYKARNRLGAERVALLFDKTAIPLAASGT